jgi:hypothetical protein
MLVLIAEQNIDAIVRFAGSIVAPESVAGRITENRPHFLPASHRWINGCSESP